ncbi:MAG: PDZ domain-containing protein [Gemmatimonadaceae bacterium]
MQRKTLLFGGVAVLTLAPLGTPSAQTARERERARAEARADELEKARRGMTAFAYAFGDDRERPRLGISTEASGMRDTLGLLVTDVTTDGPAAKAGIEEGDRIQAANGVNLRLSREDAGEEDMEGVATRRLIRTLGKAKIGDEVDLRVWSNGSVKNVKVKTVSVDVLERGRWGEDFKEFEGSDRASLGIGLGSMGSRRDTLGVLITSVTADGPAEKAGLIEGDRIQSINGVDLRVPAEDAGDMGMSSSRWRRLTRELEKAKAGDEVELRVYSAGSTKSVRVKTVKQSELREHGGAFFMGGDVPRAFAFPRGQMSLPFKTMIRPGITQLRVAPDIRIAPRIVVPKIAPAMPTKIRRVITI